MRNDTRLVSDGDSVNNWYGCFEWHSLDSAKIGGGNHWRRMYLGFDASRSSNRYGDYTEVNPLYNSTLMLIKF